MSGLPTAQRILAVIRLRARRLALWTEHLWQTGQASPDRGPAIGPAEVARLLTPATMRQAEAAFYAANAADLSMEAATAAAELELDPGWATIRRLFGLTPDEASLLALLLAVELDPGLARVVAYLHDEGGLTQPTSWLAAPLAGVEPVLSSYTNLRRWLLAAPREGALPERLAIAWQADPAVAQAIFSGIWRDPAIAEAATRIEPAEVAALPCLHPQAKSVLAQMPDPRDAELVGPPGIGRQTLAAQCAAAGGGPLLAVDLQALVEAGGAPGPLLTRTLRQAAMTGALAYFRNAQAAPESDWTRARGLGVPYLRGVRHPTVEAQPITLAPLPIDARLALWRGAG